MKAMIFAAGEGRRMRPLTLATPKPLLHVGAFSLLEHHIIHLSSVGVTEVIVNTSYLSEQIVTALRHMDLRGMKCHISVEDVPLETGGGILRALPYLGDEPFILVNADVWSNYDFNHFMADSLSSDCLAHLVLVENPPHHEKGDFALDKQGMCIPREDGLPSYTFSGMSLIRPELIADFSGQRECFPLVEALNEAIDARRVAASIFRGIWCDVGTVDRLEYARSQHTKIVGDRS